MTERSPLTRRRWLAHVGVLGVLLIAALAIGLQLGGADASWRAAVEGDETARAILLSVRGPRVLLGALVGGALALAGAIFQALLRNPLADPYVLGVAGGASIGRLAAVLLGGSTLSFLGGAGILALGFVGALAAILLVAALATRNGRIDVTSLLLTGAILNAFTGALIVFLQSVLSSRQLQQTVFVLMGQLPSVDGGRLALAAVLLIGVSLWLFASAREFNAMALGERSAAQLGVEVERLKRRTFVLGSVLTGVAVSLAGMIGFVGLIVPHALRRLLGPDHRLLLPAAFLGGGAFLVLADAVARVALSPRELPVGVLTALLGGPWFLALLRAHRGDGAL